MRPHPGYRIITSVATGTIFFAFLFALLVSLSLTIIRPIYLFAIHDVGGPSRQPAAVAAQLRFGVWGVCAIYAFPGGPLCFGPKIGYNVPEDLAAIAQVSQTVLDTVESVLLAVLVLHPIVAGLGFLNLCLSIFLSIFSAEQALAVVNLAIALITALVATTSMAVDIAIITLARDNLHDLQRRFTFEIEFGNAVWISIAGVSLNWLAVVLLSARACYCLGIQR